MPTKLSIAVPHGHTINEQLRVYRGAKVMSETWKRWEGQVVAGEFPLSRYLGGSNHSAVFLTERRAGSPQKAAIKLVSAETGDAENLLRRWQQSAKLAHPHLVRIWESGRCELDGTSLLYVVMEAAEEDLAQVLPERSLTPSEVQELLPPVLDALMHIHSNGLVHGRLRPSNILASGDQVKVSADTLRSSGELVSSASGSDAYDPPEAASAKLTPAADAWSLAITLVEVMTQQRPKADASNLSSPLVPAGLPEPFSEIARRCLQVDPQQRWTIPEISARLQQDNIRPAKPPLASGPRAPATDEFKPKRNKWVFAVAAAGIAIIALFVLLPNGDRKPKISSSTPQASEVKQQRQTARTDSSESTPVARDPKPSPVTRPETPAVDSTAGPVVKGAVLNKVLPRVSPSSRDTIEGKIKVRVRVEVDPSGKVTDARLVSPGPSKYFARLALEAAREWTFTPAQVRGQAVASKWNLRFGFRRTDTEVVSEQTAP